MLGDLAKRVVNGAVLFIAAIAFFLVPIGRRTMYQHMIAIGTTEPARECVASCADAARKMVDAAKVEIVRIRSEEQQRTAHPKAPREVPASSEEELEPAD